MQVIKSGEKTEEEIRQDILQWISRLFLACLVILLIKKVIAYKFNKVVFILLSAEKTMSSPSMKRENYENKCVFWFKRQIFLLGQIV